MRIALLIANGYGVGGTIRTVFNLAQGLSHQHDVEIVSVVQHREEPFFSLPPGVRMRSLALSRKWRDRPDQDWATRSRERVGSWRLPRGEARRKGDIFNSHTERALYDYLRRTDADLVIGTRPGLNLLLARWAPPRVLTIGQEHVHLANHRRDTRTSIRRWYPRLGGLTTLTETDRRDYARELSVDPGWLTTMPNPLSPGPYPQSTLDNPIIGAASRITHTKQFPKLVAAFARVARDRPDWQLRIYGHGDATPQLRQEVLRQGMHNQVAIMGATKDVFGELAKCSIMGVSSRTEGFGMSLIEAFAVGVPVVSFDCPHGPREIITDGQDGLLVPHQDVSALAAGLARLMDNPTERQHMGAAARAAAAHYTPEVVAKQWQDYLRHRGTAATVT